MRLLDHLDGLLLPARHSNIEPHHYSDEPSFEGNLHDPARDATTLGLIPLAIAKGVPVLAICRGFQEVNVALGGTLHQKVHDVPDMLDHREDLQQPLDVQYAPAHPVSPAQGRLAGRVRRRVRRRWSIRCTGRACKRWATVWWSKPSRPTA